MSSNVEWFTIHESLSNLGTHPFYTNSDTDSDYSDIDDNEGLRKDIVLWSYKLPKTIAIFPPRPDDSLLNVAKYAEKILNFDREIEKLCYINPGRKRPTHFPNVFMINPGMAVLILPRYPCDLVLNIGDLETTLILRVMMAITVAELKQHVHKIKGINTERFDILYKNQALEDNKYLFEYKLKNQDQLIGVIHKHYDMLIYIKTFWHKTYPIYADPSMTVGEILKLVFSRTFTIDSPKEATFQDLYIPKHIMHLKHMNTVLHNDKCLSFYSDIQFNDVLTLTTVNQEQKFKNTTIVVREVNGECMQVKASPYDRWAVIALKIHGQSEIPLNMLKLYENKSLIDFSSTVGHLRGSLTVTMKVKKTLGSEDFIYGIPLTIDLGNGVIEDMLFSPNKTVKNLKEKLVAIGYPNANKFTILKEANEVSDSLKVKDVVDDYTNPLKLKMKKFPIFIYLSNSKIYKTHVEIDQTFKSLKNKIELKTGLSMNSMKIIYCGKEFQANDGDIVFDKGIGINSSLFIEGKYQFEWFQLVQDEAFLTNLPIPTDVNKEKIKKQIWYEEYVHEKSITSLETLLFWLYENKIMKRYVT